MSDPLPPLLGVMLGAGALMAWHGIRIITDKARDAAGRRTGFWWLNGGLVLIALSVFVFSMRTR
jgi:hypothetical protein